MGGDVLEVSGVCGSCDQGAGAKGRHLLTGLVESRVRSHDQTSARFVYHLEVISHSP